MLSAKPSLLRQLLLCVIRILHSKLKKSSLNASMDLRDVENCRFVVTGGLMDSGCCSFIFNLYFV